MPNGEITVETWTSLEQAQLAIDVLTPLSVALLGWFISRRLKRLDLIQFSNQKLIEKRLTVFDKLAPGLNDLYCFYRWIGHWREISPGQVVSTKRDLDRTMNVYRQLFDESVYDAYQEFVRTLFEEYQGGPGHDARIRSVVQRDGGDNRRKHGKYPWEEKWYDAFSEPGKQAQVKNIEASYRSLMEKLADSLGVERTQPKKRRARPRRSAA